ncbi:Gag-pol polyprotein [Mycena venus]|uniref:Gag-pol polyprotein n=1 Tax=Mycena venus TaxID=2733690 RepID=A0A8H7DEF6_9AGAR|nr:Gag-pol polyprotein [Mycena venus]
MAAHDAILAARAKQTRNANRKRQPAPFEKGDLVYLSTKNIKFEKGLARKLIPKFIGPYLILEDFNNLSFRLDLPDNLKQRGVHDVFHASLLRIHIPNDDRRFPGRLENQLNINADSVTQEWAIDRISGDRTWMPYDQMKRLAALEAYFEELGISEIGQLSDSGKTSPSDVEMYSAGAQLGCEMENRGIKEQEPTLAATACIYTMDHTPVFKSFYSGDGVIIPSVQIPSIYAEFNGAHAAIRRQDRASFVIADIRAIDTREVALPADSVRQFILHNMQMNNPKLDILTHPPGYVEFAQVMNDFDFSPFKFAYHDFAEGWTYRSEIHGEVSTASVRAELFAKRARMQKDYEARTQAAHRQNKGKAAVLGNGSQRPAVQSNGGSGQEEGGGCC